jgi:type I site-specific restriction endonuclease
LAQRSPLGNVVFDKPYFILVEAKQDNFDAAWGQCLAEMIAAQRLNDTLKVVVFGITSNGDRWQFGKLEDQSFTLNSTFYSIQDLDKLFAAVNYVFQQCEVQLNALIAA